MGQRTLKDWGVIAANASASLSLRVWSRDNALVGVFTVTVPQTARMLSACTWSGAGWLDTYAGADVLSITNGPIYTAPLDDITKLTAISGETLVEGYGLGIVPLVPGQSGDEPYSGGGGGGTWGSITGTLADQTDLQTALDGKQDAGGGGGGLTFGQASIIRSLGI